MAAGYLHIGFIVDHPKRDLPGAAMLAMAAVRRGFRLTVIPMYEQAFDVLQLGLDALIINYARHANRNLLEAYFYSGLPVFVLDTEGGILAETGLNSTEGLPRAIREGQFSQLLAGYMFWGPRLHQAFVEQSGMDKAHLHVTGCPRFDFASPRWSKVLRRKRKDFILVNANFPLINSRFSQSPEGEIATMVRAGWPLEYLTKIRLDQMKIHKNYIRAIAELARRNPNKDFLLRPHPFENEELYRKAFGTLGNVTVDGNGSVLTVLANCSAMIHLNCGTAVEALMLGRVPISMEFLNTDLTRQHSPLPSRISLPVQSIDELHTLLQNVNDVTASFPFSRKYDEFVYPWFYKNDGMAADRVVEVVANSLDQMAQSRAPSWRQKFSVQRRLRALQILQLIFSTMMGSLFTAHLRAVFQPNRKQKLLAMNELRTLLLQLSAHENASNMDIRRPLHRKTRMPLASLSVTASQ